MLKYFLCINHSIHHSYRYIPYDANIKINLFVQDDLIEENNEILTLHFSDGNVKVSQEEDYDVKVCMNINNFSSMLMGCVSFSRLCSLGLAKVNREECIEKINNVFALENKPMCVSAF